LHTAGACFDLLAFQVHIWCAQQQLLLLLLSGVATAALRCARMCVQHYVTLLYLLVSANTAQQQLLQLVCC
jgi:hypothetical protein